MDYDEKAIADHLAKRSKMMFDLFDQLNETPNGVRGAIKRARMELRYFSAVRKADKAFAEKYNTEFTLV
jgi:hypothetical protein